MVEETHIGEVGVKVGGQRPSCLVTEEVRDGVELLARVEASGLQWGSRGVEKEKEGEHMRWETKEWLWRRAIAEQRADTLLDWHRCLQSVQHELTRSSAMD